jgi:hypothetical protein
MTLKPQASSLTSTTTNDVRPGILFRSRPARSARGTSARMLRIIDTDGVWAVAENTETGRRSRMSVEAIVKRFEKFGEQLS